jgi:transcriptional regulator with XRE-family HTH domain
MRSGSISIGGDKRPTAQEVTDVRRERIKTAMRLVNVDQSELARRVGCTPGAINQILSGQTKRSRFLPDIAMSLGVSLRWLAGETDEPNPPDWPALPPPLTADELRLLDIYRSLPKPDRAALKRLVERMVDEGDQR